MISDYEKRQLRIVGGTFSTEHWRQYISMILGRTVSTQETNQWLVEEGERQRGKNHIRILEGARKRY